MNYYLTIDQGNSSVKVALFKDSIIERTDVLDSNDAVGALRRFVGNTPLNGAIACSVAESPMPLLEQAAKLGCRQVMEFTHTTPIPIVNGYASPQSLGIDRLAAAIGAFQISPGRDLLVADLGTACTYDCVSTDGRFLGGNIAPGVELRLRSLNLYTHRLPLIDDIETPVMEFGTDTRSAMTAGALRGVVAEIGYFRRLGADRPRRLVLTGGWVKYVMPFLKSESDIIYEPNLVHSGLLRVYNHNK